MSDARFDGERRLLLLTTPRTSHVAVLTDDLEARDALVDVYTGPAVGAQAASDIARLDLRPPARRRPFESRLDGRDAYPVAGGVRFGQPAFAVTMPDGVRATEWRFTGHEASSGDGSHTVALTFADDGYPLAVTLTYRVHDDTDVVERWASVTHTDPSGEPVEVHRLDAATARVPRLPGYRLTHLVGQWGAETQLRRVDVPVGETVLGSRLGVTSHQANPWYAIDDGTATEEHGAVFTGTLAWSGSWRMVVQRFPFDRVQVLAGAGHEGFGPVRLAPGETMTTPVFASLYAEGGFGAASRAWHAYTLSHVLPRAEETRPVLYNSWEATLFDISAGNQMALAERAAELGVELFVVDDGWFGARTSDRAGLGDWQVNRDRFPEGLGPLVSKVHELGMSFGIWVEPEMVNPDSDLYRAHPDWVYHFQNRTRHEMRNQLVLNLARDDVAEWVYEQMHTLLADHDIRFVKWDMNRPFTEAGWPEEQDQNRLWLDHVRNLYAVFDRLRAAYPDVTFESCSGGGGRIDLGILARTDQVWTSDNTDASDRLVIQHGLSQLYPSRVMTCWVTDVPNSLTSRSVSLRYRFHAAMCGVLGIGGDLSAWSAAELAEAAELVSTYKRIRPLVQHGVQYRLRAPSTGCTVVQYVTPSADEAAVFAFLDAGRFGARPAPVRLAGLDPSARYAVSGGTEVLTGAALSSYGLPLDLTGNNASELYHLVRVRD